jgi:hypothetical protein
MKTRSFGVPTRTHCNQKGHLGGGGTDLLDDIRAKLGFGQLDDMVLELVDEGRQIGIRPIEDVLKDIIPKLIL